MNKITKGKMRSRILLTTIGKFQILACALILIVLPILALPGLALAQSFPNLSGQVVDAANIINTPTTSQLTQLLASHEQKTGNQFVIVTIQSLNGFAIEEYTLNLGREWGIGQEDSNNGLILLIAMSERKIRIEVGYGLEGDMPDATAKTIIDQTISPLFKSGDMNAGILAGATRIVSVLENKETVEGNTNGNWSELDKTKIYVIVLFLLYIGFGILGSLMRGIYTVDEHRNNRRGGSYGVIGDNANSNRLGGSSGIRFGGGFSGGGGSFGGGGASGGW